MIYLSTETTKFLYPFLMELQRTKSGVVKLVNSQNNDSILQVRFISETSLGLKFSIEIPDIFHLIMMKQNENIVVYKYKDAEHYPNKQLLSIAELDLIKDLKPIRVFHFVLKAFTEAIIYTLKEKEQGSYNQEFEYYSFRTVRFLLLMFIADNPIVASWGTHALKLLQNGIIFSVQGHHFTGQIKILYNVGADLFEISFIQNDMVIGQRTGVFFDDLIECIDKKVEYITEYSK